MTREKMWEEFETGIIDVIERWKKRLEQEPFNIDTYCEEHFCVMVDKDVWEKAEKALKQEPCEDAISRQAVLNMQYRIDDSATLSTRDVVNVDDIKDLPSVNPQEPKTGYWIPVSERLPEIVEFYLTSIKWDDGTERVTISWFDGTSFKAEVIAWMPLPKQYEPQESEEV